MEAFPSEYIGLTTSDHRFQFGPRAMIFVRKSNLDIARIEVNWWSDFMSAFPNRGIAIREVINNPALGVRPHVTETKVECLFGPHNIESLIEALSPSS
jgi:hypothetical protein